MRLHVKLSTTLRVRVPGYDPAGGLAVDLADGATVRNLALHLGLPLEEIKITMVNGRHASLDTPLSDTDRVAFFPAVGGG
ncbi:MoaD/ThiS family protein [Desulfovibrio sp. OttesenSCG-928-M16]|nr:MoaD/ThiS family protein [Desulfovibrio sp. OttesenSCG-928-M16]